MRFLYAAYAATWLIHIAYLLTLWARFARLRDDIEDLRKQ